MAFEALLEKSMTEPQLLERIVSEIRAHYSGYQSNCYFLKLSKGEESKTSHVAWIKNFKDAYDLGDFYFDTKYERACIMIKVEEDHYELLCEGFYFVSRFKLWLDKTSRPYCFECTVDREQRLMCPREILEGFGELTMALASSKWSKAVS